jgi:hypothetical protein
MSGVKLTKAQRSLLEIVEQWHGLTKSALPGRDWGRLDRLVEMGLVRRAERARYVATDAGRLALQGQSHDV